MDTRQSNLSLMQLMAIAEAMGSKFVEPVVIGADTASDDVERTLPIPGECGGCGKRISANKRLCLACSEAEKPCAP